MPASLPGINRRGRAPRMNAEAFLKEKRLSSLQRGALQQDLERIESVLKDIDRGN